MFAVVISEKGGAERRETFDQDEVTIGRVQGNDLMLPKGNVSKRHCRLECQDGRFLVTDQESTNGTYVNRRRITQSTIVREGDRIYVGDFILRIEPSIAEAPLASAPAEGVLPRAPMGTSPDIERGSFPGPVVTASTFVTAETTSDRAKGNRDSNANVEFSGLSGAVSALILRSAQALDSALLDREPDAALTRRVERLLDDTYTELMIEGDVVSGLDEAKVKASALDELLKLGPLDRLMADRSVQEIAVSGAGHIAVYRGGQRSPRELPFYLSESIPRVVQRLCRRVSTEPVRAAAYRVALPELQFDLEILGGEIVPAGGAFRLIRREQVSSSLEHLVRSGVISRTMATFLRHCVTARVNVLVVGSPRSGASEVLAALCAASDGDRIFGLAGDESAGSNYENVVWLDLPQGEASSVLRIASGFAGHRLLIDDVSGARASALLAAVGEGAQGIVARLKARSIERGLNRLCSEMSLHQPGVTPFVLAEAFIAAFDIALEVTRLPDGRSRVVRIAELERGESSLVRGNDIFDFSVERTATGGSIEGTFRSTGHTPQVAAELKNHGLRIDASLFSRAPASDER